jgi:hypothetical protein
MARQRPLLLGALALVSLGACGNRSLSFPTDGDATATDLATPPPSVDLAMPTTPIDLAVPVVDLAGGGSGVTGAPCVSASDCVGLKAVCIRMDAQGTTWPGGYCTSLCNPMKNDPMTGANAQCPGMGTCAGQGAQGSCLTFCSASGGPNPCTRAGYSCFQGCEPTSYSQCDPRKQLSCGPGQTCVRDGYDAVGACLSSCDPFAQGCGVGMRGPQCCYGSYDTGEGFCTPPTAQGGPGDPCLYTTDCGCGFVCSYQQNGKGFCRAFCGGPKQVPCKGGASCFDYAPGVVPSTVLGVCGA